MSVIIATIILTIGSGLIDIAVREFNLARVSVESLKAFGAAEMGIDCAFHEDVNATDTGGSPADSGALSEFPGPDIEPPPFAGYAPSSPYDGDIENCGGATIQLQDPPDHDTNGTVEWYTTRFDSPLLVEGTMDGPCAEVTVTKYFDTATLRGTTTIESRGRNICNATDKRVERAIELIWSTR